MSEDGERDAGACEPLQRRRGRRGRPAAYVGVSIATSALERPRALVQTSAVTTASGAPVTTTSSGSAPARPAGSDERPQAAPPAPRLDRGERVERALPVPSERHDPMHGGRPRPDHEDRAPRARVCTQDGGRGAHRLVEARPPGAPTCVAASTSSTTATLSRGASSSSRTMSSPRRAEVGQWTARSGSPSTYSRTPCGSRPLGRRTCARRPPSFHAPVSVKSVVSSGHARADEKRRLRGHLELDRAQPERIARDEAPRAEGIAPARHGVDDDACAAAATNHRAPLAERPDPLAPLEP